MPTLPTPATWPELSDAARPPLHVIILHDDQAAYVRALRMLVKTFRGEPEAATLRPLPWRFDELESVRLRALALADSPRADVFVIASSGVRPMSPRLREWLEIAFSERREKPTAVIAIGQGAEGDGEIASTVRALAERAGIDFLESSAAAVAA